MADPATFFDEFGAELKRLGLRLSDLPGLAVSLDQADAILARLRSLEPGATWADVMPGMPTDWVAAAWEMEFRARRRNGET